MALKNSVVSENTAVFCSGKQLGPDALLLFLGYSYCPSVLLQLSFGVIPAGECQGILSKGIFIFIA